VEENKPIEVIPLSYFVGLTLDFCDFTETDMTYTSGVLTEITLEGGIKDSDKSVIYPFKQIKIPFLTIKEFNSLFYSYCKERIDHLPKMQASIMGDTSFFFGQNKEVEKLIEYLEDKVDVLEIEELQYKVSSLSNYNPSARARFNESKEILKWVKENLNG